MEGSTSKGENLNAIMKRNDQHDNGDGNALPRKANLSGLQKMDSIISKKFDVERMIRELKKKRIAIWNDEIKKTFSDVENNFSKEHQLIIKILRSHNWRKDIKTPQFIKNQLCKRKKRILNQAVSQRQKRRRI